jgi:hypothetical protein
MSGSSQERLTAAVEQPLGSDQHRTPSPSRWLAVLRGLVVLGCVAEPFECLGHATVKVGLAVLATEERADDEPSDATGLVTV